MRIPNLSMLQLIKPLAIAIPLSLVIGFLVAAAYLRSASAANHSGSSATQMQSFYAPALYQQETRGKLEQEMNSWLSLHTDVYIHQLTWARGIDDATRFALYYGPAVQTTSSTSYKVKFFYTLYIALAQKRQESQNEINAWLAEHSDIDVTAIYEVQHVSNQSLTIILYR